MSRKREAGSLLSHWLAPDRDNGRISGKGSPKSSPSLYRMGAHRVVNRVDHLGWRRERGRSAKEPLVKIKKADGVELLVRPRKHQKCVVMQVPEKRHAGASAQGKFHSGPFSPVRARHPPAPRSATGRSRSALIRGCSRSVPRTTKEGPGRAATSARGVLRAIAAGVAVAPSSA